MRRFCARRASAAASAARSSAAARAASASATRESEPASRSAAAAAEAEASSRAGVAGAEGSVPSGGGASLRGGVRQARDGRLGVVASRRDGLELALQRVDLGVGRGERLGGSLRRLRPRLRRRQSRRERVVLRTKLSLGGGGRRPGARGRRSDGTLTRDGGRGRGRRGRLLELDDSPCEVLRLLRQRRDEGVFVLGDLLQRQRVHVDGVVEESVESSDLSVARRDRALGRVHLGLHARHLRLGLDEAALQRGGAVVRRRRERLCPRLRARRARAFGDGGSERLGEFHARLDVLAGDFAEGVAAGDDVVELRLDALVVLLELEVPLRLLLLPKVQLGDLILELPLLRGGGAQALVARLVLLDELHVE